MLSYLDQLYCILKSFFMAFLWNNKTNEKKNHLQILGLENLEILQKKRRKLSRWYQFWTRKYISEFPLDKPAKIRDLVKHQNPLTLANENQILWNRMICNAYRDEEKRSLNAIWLWYWHWDRCWSYKCQQNAVFCSNWIFSKRQFFLHFWRRNTQSHWIWQRHRHRHKWHWYYFQAIDWYHAYKESK